MATLIRSVALLALGVALLAASTIAQKSPADSAEKKSPRAKLGAKALDFELPTLNGKVVKLSKAKGKIIVLEWFNPDCPFVTRSHTNGTLKGLAARYLADRRKDVIWLAINSGAPGKQGHGEEANRKGIERYGLKNPILRDETGAVGRMYGVKKTPTIVIIDQKFNVVYWGGEDNTMAMRRGDADERVNHVDQVIEALRKGEKPPVTKSKPFG